MGKKSKKANKKGKEKGKERKERAESEEEEGDAFHFGGRRKSGSWSFQDRLADFAWFAKVLLEKFDALASQVRLLTNSVIAVGNEDEIKVFVSANKGVDYLQG